MEVVLRHRGASLSSCFQTVRSDPRPLASQNEGHMLQHGRVQRHPSGGAEAHSFLMRRLLKLQGRIRDLQRQERLGAATEHLKARARTAVHRWQRQMAARGKKATRWLKGKQRRMTSVKAPGAGQPTEALHHGEPRTPGILTAHLGQACRQQAGRCAEVAFQPNQVWSAEAFHEIGLTKACSAPGVDGWRGDEIKYWPRQAWVVYSELLCKWLARGSYPRAWQEMRQVQLPKASTKELSGDVSAADLRPIVVISILWRVASSAVGSCPQVRKFKPPTNTVGCRRHIHHGLSKIAGPQAQGTPVVSLDYAKCLDRVDPKLACDLMAAAGLPAQGDGLEPLALNVMLSAPVVSSFGSGLRQSVFLDDRAFAVEQVVARALDVWRLWSQVLGIEENDGKRVRILGVDFTVSSETLKLSLAARVEEDMRIGKRLLTKGIALDVRRDLWRTRVLPLVTWGHPFDPPRHEDVKQLQKLGTSVAYLHRAAGVHLRRLLEGHNMDMMFQSGMSCLPGSACEWKLERRCQDSRTGHVVGKRLRLFAGQGCATEQARIDYAQGNLSTVAHSIRAEWRGQLLCRFRESGRRDSSQLQGWHPGANCMCMAIRLHQEAPAEGNAVTSGLQHCLLRHAADRWRRPSMPLVQ
ncbi:unnamed protein product [Symbiodinium sp. CCMP2592]|nr:unnamed protein product [Symbiodinium sp. CCMP2592]